MLALYCLFRFLSCCCCDCLSGGRYQRRRRKGRGHEYAGLHDGGLGYGGHDGMGYREPRRVEGSGRGGEDALPRMPVWDRGAHGRVGGEEGEMRREKEVEYQREQKVPMLASRQAPAPRFPAEMDASSGGDLGQQQQQQQGYRPFGAAYMPYSADAWGGRKGQQGGRMRVDV
ncbi:MAG: hypothetical protein LQ338_005888 [Usnochroma carphineum]|nr:MAG: hypothetical protein LQ338_005888 [Usnochroma carphineum]